MPKISQSRACQSLWPGVVCELDFATANNFWISCNLHYFFTYRLLNIILFCKHKYLYPPPLLQRIHVNKLHRISYTMARTLFIEAVK